MKTVLSDIELIERLQKGDMEAFDLIYQKYSKALFIFGYKYLRSSVEAEELVQSVFLKIWENHKSLKEETSFRSYIFTISYNDIRKFYRKRSYQQKFISDIKYEYSQPSTAVEDSIDYKSVLELLEKIVNKLSERQKVIFLKSRKDGKSAKEIAEELGLSPGTVDNNISESLKFIRKHLNIEVLPLILLISVILFCF